MRMVVARPNTRWRPGSDRINVSTVEHGLDDAPPAGTAIVRPLRHVQAVRERHEQQIAERAAGDSRSALAWSWALGESAVAPVTDRVTDAPPSGADIEAEIAEADERRLRGDCENRADGAANVLRWLIGADDRVPVRGKDRGALVGGFGDIVRSPDEIAQVLEDARRRCRAEPQAADYVVGVIATLEWILGERPQAPISSQCSWHVTTSQLKQERLLAEDLAEQPAHLTIGEQRLAAEFGVGVKLSVTWLLGEIGAPSI
jgi:hypothetical protein